MDLQNGIDVQCTKIADGLATLKEAMNQPLARRVLELETNLESGRNLDQLFRLERSLLQYLERKGDLLYVGFMGHFSSGKSSTINSLLNLWDSGQAREVNLNPTDKAITLITHPHNTKSLIGLKSEGSIPIRTDFVETDLLNNIVLADTPGSGDPLLVNEMVRDFLPVCDIILYFISAATPLTDADTPMLRAKTRELQFIPMRFVVTRGDEFRRDTSASISATNFSEELVDQFLEEIVERIGKILCTDLDKSRDFVIIDNRSRYNIDQLVNFLVAQSDIQDSSKRVLMHGHKVAYFISHSQRIQSYFKTMLDQKTEVLRKIVDHARLNITRYQDKVQITNNKLTESWVKNLAAMEDVRADLIKKLDESRQGSALHENPFDEEKLQQWQRSVAKEIETSSRYHLAEIVRELELRAAKALSGFFQELRSRLRQTDIDKLKIVGLDNAERLTFGADAGSLSLSLPFPLKKQVEECPEIMKGILHDKYSTIEAGLTSLHSKLVALQPLKELEEFVSRSITSLEDDIKTYFDNVYVYRSGVFAIQVRESIAKLGIETELDKIESEFEDDFKEKVVVNAKEEIFPQVGILIPKFTMKLRELLDAYKQERDVVRAYELKQEKILISTSHLNHDEGAWAGMVNEYSKSINDHLSMILRKTYLHLGQVLAEYSTSASDLRSQRKRRYRTITLVSGGVGLGLFLLFRFFNYVPDQTLILIIGTGVLSNLLGDIIGYGFARYTDKSPERMSSLQRKYEKRLLSEYDEIVDTESKEFRLSGLSSSSLFEFIKGTWTKQAGTYRSEILGSQLAADYERVKSFANQYNGLIGNYKALVNEIAQVLTGYFRDVDANLLKLQSISRSISTVAIEPSFTLLDTTHQDLLRVRDIIAKTPFA